MPIPHRKPSFVYFDLDDTILDHRKAEKRALADLKIKYPEFGNYEPKAIEDTYHAGNVVLWNQYSSGEVTKEQLRRKRFVQLFDRLGISGLDPMEVSYHYIDRYTHYWDYIEGAKEAFFAIADRFPVGILTNGFAKIQHAKLAQFAELRDRLDACVISEEFGYMKPHPKLFQHASEKANTAPEEIVYVGDSMFSDVEGGQKAGWTVIWYAPKEEQSPSHVLHARDWSEIADMLS